MKREITPGLEVVAAMLENDPIARSFQTEMQEFLKRMIEAGMEPVSLVTTLAMAAGYMVGSGLHGNDEADEDDVISIGEMLSGVLTDSAIDVYRHGPDGSKTKEEVKA